MSERVPFEVQAAAIEARKEAHRLKLIAEWEQRPAQRRKRRAGSVALARREPDYELLVRQKESAYAGLTGELADIVLQQDRDARWGHLMPKRPWLVSLDARDSSGRELIETLIVDAA